jgi:hypothetical protein
VISPTPWTYTENGDVVDADGCVLPVSGIAQPHGYVPKDDVSYGNGRLLSVAPELLAACKEAVSLIARTHPARFEFAADRDSFKYILSVIAKAEDRQ